MSPAPCCGRGDACAAPQLGAERSSAEEKEAALLVRVHMRRGGQASCDGYSSFVWHKSSQAHR